MKRSIYGENPQKERLRIEKALTKVCQWTEKAHGVTVSFGFSEVNQFDPDSKTISICTRSNLRDRLNTLLHECGHLVLRSDKKAFLKRFPDIRDGRTGKEFRLDILREEVLAWEKGLEVAKELRIKIDTFWYRRHLQVPLWSYIEWVKNPKGWRI